MGLIEDAILQGSKRGMDRLARHFPEDYCASAASEIVSRKRGTVLITTGFIVDGRPETDGPLGAIVLGQALRSICYVAFVPFYFIKAGSLVSIPAIASWASIGIIVLLFFVKVGAKFAGVLPVTRLFKYEPREGMFTTFMMSTGLTFGTISLLYGLTNGFVSPAQYGILVTVVISTAVIPTLIANKFFMPKGIVDNQSK